MYIEDTPLSGEDTINIEIVGDPSSYLISYETISYIQVCKTLGKFLISKIIEQ